MSAPKVMILGIGNLLLSDEGFGIHVINKLREAYEFDENVSIEDGGVLGMHLIGIVSEADYLIVIDVIRNNGKPGALYRLDNDDLPERVRAKNSLHQIDFLEAMTFCQYGLDKAPEAVVLGVEPLDIETFDVELTPLLREKVDEIIPHVLKELDRLGAGYRKKENAS